MKQRNLKALALLGIFSALTITTTIQSNEPPRDPNEGNRGYFLMSEDELLMELNQNGTDLYESLSPEGKSLARYVASQRCNASNKCKGLNACKTDTNECAGKGTCKGTSKCAFSDKNLAVKVVADKMTKKRSKLSKENK